MIKTPMTLLKNAVATIRTKAKNGDLLHIMPVGKPTVLKTSARKAAPKKKAVAKRASAAKRSRPAAKKKAKK